MIRIENEEQNRALADRLRQLTGAELAAEVMELIEYNQERWAQGSWRMELNGTETAVEEFLDDPLNPACTTAFCFAGWVGALHRVKWALNALDDSIGDPELCDCTGKYCVAPEHQIFIQSYAARVLGLTGWGAEELFQGDNSLKVLRAGVEAIQRGNHVGSAVRRVRDEGQADDTGDELVYG